MDRTPSLAGVGKRLKAALTVEQRELVGRFLVGIAAANGTIDRKEITALRARVQGAGRRRRAAEPAPRGVPPATKEPVEVHRPTTPARPGEAIPPRPNGDGAIRLDAGSARTAHARDARGGPAARRGDAGARSEARRQRRRRTRRTVRHRPVAAAADGPSLRGLDPRYHVVLAELLTRPSGRAATSRRWSAATP